MIPFGWHVWRGETNRRYRFKITLTKRNLPDEGGIYVFVRRRFFFFLKPLYIGKAANLKSRLGDHERWAEAWWRRGATERHIMCVKTEAARQLIEEDLVRYHSPKMNDMLVPRDSDDAPNNQSLKQGWISATDYYRLNKRAA